MNEIISISGLPGSGTSTAADLLSKKTGMEIVSSGEIFRALAAKYDMSLEEFSKHAESDDKIDLELDKGLLDKAVPGNILEGRLTGHMLQRNGIDSFRVWLKAPLEVRVERIEQREGDEDIYKRTVEREESEYYRYKKYYGIDLDDMSVYDMVIDSSEHSPEEIVDKIIEGVKDASCEGKDL